MLRQSSLVLFLTLSVASAQAEIFRLQWDDIVIEQEHSVGTIVDHAQPPTANSALCPFLGGKIDCWEVQVPEGDDPTYPVGHDYPLQVPVALFPELEPYDDEEDLMDSLHHEYHQVRVARLPDFVPRVPPRSQWAKLSAAPLAKKFETTGFSDARRTIGGPETLRMWSYLARNPPSPVDCKDQYCYLAVTAESDDAQAIFWCGSFSDGEVFSPPYPRDCDLVLFVENELPYLLSYTGADLCGGCGAGGGFYCIFGVVTGATVESITSSLVAFMAGSPFELDMQRRGGMLIGKHTAKQSLWKEGYYERAFATAMVTEWSDGDIVVNLTYNLLVSSEPSANDHVYHGLSARDVGERSSDYDWFQQRLATLFNDNFAMTIDPSAGCSYEEF